MEKLKFIRDVIELILDQKVLHLMPDVRPGFIALDKDVIIFMKERLLRDGTQSLIFTAVIDYDKGKNGAKPAFRAGLEEPADIARDKSLPAPFVTLDHTIMKDLMMAFKRINEESERRSKPLVLAKRLRELSSDFKSIHHKK